MDMASQSGPDSTQPVRQAVLLWAAFLVAVIVVNGTVPFVLGRDLSTWSAAPLKFALVGLLIYGGLFLAAPLILVKGWRTVRQPAFLAPLFLAMVAITLWHSFRGVNALAVLALAYLHGRFDLSELGFRSRGWKGDVAAILVMALLSVLPLLLRKPLLPLHPGPAAVSALDRLFANPASSVENLFYFGFLTERLSHRMGRGLTPPLIGLMYTVHEMTNPEYWYGGMPFALTFVLITVVAYFYLWRRSVVLVWLGDGLSRFFRAL